VTAVALLALLALAFCALPLWLKLPLLAAVMLVTWRSLHALAVSPVCAAGWSPGNDWSLRLIDHEDVAATLASFRVFGEFLLLRLRTTERGMQVLVLAPDNSDADIRRRLRMRLATMQPENAISRL
jgi:toxin CptA